MNPAADNDAKVDEYRRRYRGEHIAAGYSGYLHLGLLVAICLAAIGSAAWRLQAPSVLEWLIVPATFLYANLVEYCGHRWAMHRRVRGLGLIFERHTCQHHRFFTAAKMEFDSSRDFKAVLFPLVLVAFYLLGFAVPSALLVGWIATPNAAYLFVATAVAYYLNYEVLHFAYHSRAGSWWRRLPGVERLRRLHLNHHRPELMSHKNFNITYPIADYLFGTHLASGELPPP